MCVVLIVYLFVWFVCLFVRSFSIGYALFWHIPVPETLPSNILDSSEQANQFFEEIPIRLIAIPLERSHLVSKTLAYRGVFSYKPGLYYLSQVLISIQLNISS
jgi:hypothetical protein